jgi:hypothetical protein
MPIEAPSNYETALKAEAKRVVRCFQAYSSETRANHAASFRLGHQQRKATGEYFYTHPSVLGVAFPKRILAARAALANVP